ncbi:MAG: hypothetical protein AAGF12_15420 [Myxococcota bacterium]
MDEEQAFWACLGGDPQPAQSCARDGAWLPALTAALWLQEGQGSAPPLATSVAPPELPALLAAEAIGRAALLSFHGEQHLRCHERITELSSANPGSRLLQVGSHLRQCFLSGQSGALIEAATELEAMAMDAQRPAMVVEAAAFRALGELEAGELPQAVGTARRAARMARTEGLAQPEFLANLVLARARRFSNRAHLAVRILTALGEIAPEPWLPWIAWELVAAGAVPVAARLVAASRAPGSVAPRALLSMLDAADAGDLAGFHHHARRASEAFQDHAPLRSELHRIWVGLDVTKDLSSAEPTLRAWALGEGVAPPSGTMAISLLPRDNADDVVAFVVALHDARSRRVFGRGLGLSPDAVDAAKPGRLEAALSVLALAAEPMEKPEFFRAVYGFEYKREIHEGPLEVLIHRVRKAAGDRLDIDRQERLISAKVLKPFSIPDPRCAKPLDERLLTTLAERRGGSAKDMAKALGVPLRTVQGVIRNLADDGACLVEKQGRRVVYKVEDTTFSDPTMRNIRRHITG